jgi:Transposase
MQSKSQIKSIGIDLGKTTFHLVALGTRSQVVIRKKFSRSQLLEYTANLPSSLIGMEAGVGSHFLGRALREQGHEVRLIPAQFVRPFVKSNKNDYCDAEAIAEAVDRENMRFVGAGCDLSRRCTQRSSPADGRSVTETTMRTVEVVMLEPRRKLLISLFGVEVVANVSPLAQGGLDEAFRLAVGAGSVRAGEAVLDAELETSGAEVAGAIAGAVVGEQAANGDAMLGIEGNGGVQEGDGGFALLVGQHAGEGEAGVIVDGDVQSLPAGELGAAAAAAIATNGNLLIAGHALDVEMEQIAGSGMLVAHDGRSRMQVAPAVEMSPLQNAADGGGAEAGGLGDLIGGAQLAAQGNDLGDQLRRGLARAVQRTGGTIPQAGQPQGAVAGPPLGGGFSADVERGCSRVQR